MMNTRRVLMVALMLIALAAAAGCGERVDRPVG